MYKNDPIFSLSDFFPFYDAATALKSVLQTAVEKGDFQVVQALLAGPDLDEPSLHDGDLLVTACDQPNVEIFRVSVR